MIDTTKNNKIDVQNKEEDEDVMVDLNPKKMKQGDNIFMDFMALYSRASVNDKRQQMGATRSQ